MIANSFLIQLLMLILALSVFFSYVKPTFLNIGKIQDEIAAYIVELGKVSAVNQQLRDLNDQVLALPASDMSKLNTYMPDEVDEVKIVSDIFAMADEARVYAKTVKYNGLSKAEFRSDADDKKDDKPITHEISVDVTGTYEQAKKFLALLEINNYPLEVHDLKITSTELGIISLQMKVITYTHK